jgi:hypothetical protein
MTTTNPTMSETTTSNSIPVPTSQDGRDAGTGMNLQNDQKARHNPSISASESRPKLVEDASDNMDADDEMCDEDVDETCDNNGNKMDDKNDEDDSIQFDANQPSEETGLPRSLSPRAQSAAIWIREAVNITIVS